MCRVIWLVAYFLAASTWAAAADFTLREGRPEDVGIAPHVLAEAVALVRQSVERGDIHGAVLLVARRGQIVLHEAAGWRNAEDRLPMKRDTLFKMASNTKPVIAAATLKLVGEGRLDLDAPVGRYIPHWENGRAADVTVRQLLSHTSGLRIPGVFVRPLLAKSDEVPHAPSLQAEVDRFAEIGVEKEPGASFSYNNSGFQVLGRLIEVASGLPLKTYLRESIYKPLRMDDSWNYESDAPTDRMSRVYSWKDGKRTLKWKPEDGPDWPIVRGSGGMVNTARDYATFCQMWLNRGVYAGQRLLKQEMVAEATRPQTIAAHSMNELGRPGIILRTGLGRRTAGHLLAFRLRRNEGLGRSPARVERACVYPKSWRQSSARSVLQTPCLPRATKRRRQAGRLTVLDFASWAFRSAFCARGRPTL